MNRRSLLKSLALAAVGTAALRWAGVDWGMEVVDAAYEPQSISYLFMDAVQ